MAEAIVFILIFIAIIAFAALAFAGWVLVSVISIVWSLLQWMFGNRRQPKGFETSPRRRPTLVSSEPTVCRNALCVAMNPPGARFCRRCGQRQPTPIAVPVRRTAAW